MAPKKSALSSALAGGPEVPAPLPPKASKVLDPAAFPCLTFALEVDAGAGVTHVEPQEEQDFDVSHMQVFGSLPTNTMLKGVPLVSRLHRARLLIDFADGTGCMVNYPRIVKAHSTTPVRPPQADYELNPRSRRAGKESMPADADSGMVRVHGWLL